MATIETKPRADGTTAYRVRYRLAPGKNPTVDTFDTAGEAVDYAALVDRIGGEAARSKRHAIQQASTITLSETLDSYLKSATDIAAATGSEYRRELVRSGLDHTLGMIPVDLITREDIEKWLHARLAQKTKRGNRPISPTTVRAEHGTLSMILNHAVQRGWITHNPAKGMRLPKAQRDELEILTDEEFLALHAAITDRYKPLVWLLAATGLRWGEATALQWRDIAGELITVRQAWKHDTDSHRRILGPPKTEKGRRRVETTEAVVLSLGKRGPANGFVFTMPDGKPVAYSRFYPTHWLRACAAAKLVPTPKIHGLRHFAASHMLAQGTDIFEVSRALGHGDIGITTKVYGHLVPSKTRPTAVHAARLDELRRKALES